jgi:hypothetical protein
MHGRCNRQLHAMVHVFMSKAPHPAHMQSCPTETVRSKMALVSGGIVE